MSRSNQLFVTGTDTDVGKTVVAAALMKGLNELSWRALYWKPIQAGLEHPDADIVENVNSGSLSAPSLLTLPTAASPDQALIHDGIEGLSAEAIAKRAPQHDGILITEGAGGILVPLNPAGQTWIDVLRYWRSPVLVVARTGLGTLNHTTLTVRHLIDHGCNVLGVILNGERHEANEASLTTLLPKVPLYSFPPLPDSSQPDQQTCIQLARFVTQQLTGYMQNNQRDASTDDSKFVWHPYTQHLSQRPTPCFVGAEGPWLLTADGRRLIDSTSSWWVNTIGHGRPEIHAAISRQQASMDHVIFANAIHEPGVRLARRLVELTNHHLQRVFYSDNGSTAVEIGMKMAFQAWVNRGDTQRTKFLTLKASYHGDTIGTMSLADAGQFHSAFTPLMFATTSITPVTSHPSALSPDGPTVRERALKDLSDHLAQHHHEYAAFVLEPLIQGAGGMLMHDAAWLQGAVKLCRQYGLYIVLDEVFSGMARVGAPFAYQRAQIDPDIICIAKGLTGGTLPFAATIAKELVFQEFLHDDRSKAFLHGHSYTGNPIGCAAALATLDIFEREDLPARARALEKRFNEWLVDDATALPIKNGRALGGILAMELAGNRKNSATHQYFDDRAETLPAIAAEHGLFLRPLGNTVYLVLPLTITDNDLSFTLNGLNLILKKLI